MNVGELIGCLRASAVAGVLFVASSLPAAAVFVSVGDLGSNPNTSSVDRQVGSTPFEDAWLFSLDSSLLFSVAANSANAFADPNAKINDFEISIWSFGANEAFDGGGGDDKLIYGPNAAVQVGLNQFVGVGGLLDAGKYFLGITGDGVGAVARYDGNISTVAVPVPVIGAGLPGLILACGGLVFLARRRRSKFS